MAATLKEVIADDGLSFSPRVLDEIRLLHEAPDDTSITTRQAHLMTGVAESTLEQWRSTRRIEIPFYKFGRSVRYKLGDVRRFMRDSRIQPEGFAAMQRLESSGTVSRGVAK